MSASIPLGIPTSVAVYAYAYVPIAKETMIKFQNMEMSNTTAVMLSTEVRERPSAFDYSMTRYFSVE
jgi:hypothetical protein